MALRSDLGVFWQLDCGVDQLDYACGVPTRLVRCGVCGRLHRTCPVETPRTSEEPSNCAVEQPSPVSDLTLPVAGEDEQDWSLFDIPQVEPQESGTDEEDISDLEPLGPGDLDPNHLSLEFSPLAYSVLCEYDGQQQETCGLPAADWIAYMGLVGSLVASLPVWMSVLYWFVFIWACLGKCNASTAVGSHYTYRLAYLWQVVVRCLRSCVGLSPEDRWEIMTRMVDGGLCTVVANPLTCTLFQVIHIYYFSCLMILFPLYTFR